jgi:hypothetical protein
MRAMHAEDWTFPFGGSGVFATFGLVKRPSPELVMGPAELLPYHPYHVLAYGSNCLIRFA